MIDAQYEWSVTARPTNRPTARSSGAAGPAKTWLGETERFAWWELVDRWRYGPIAQLLSDPREAAGKR